VSLERLAVFGALALIRADRDSGVAIPHDLHICILGAGPPGQLVRRDDLRFACHLSVVGSGDELIGEQRSQQVGIVALLRLQPLLLKVGDGFLNVLRPCSGRENQQPNYADYALRMERAPRGEGQILRKWSLNRLPDASLD